MKNSKFFFTVLSICLFCHPLFPQTQVGIDLIGEAAEDRFGFAVSLSGDGSRLAMGAYLNDGSATDAGHVRVYDRIGGSWTQVGGDIDGEATEDNAGWSVSVSTDGTTVAVGAPLNNGSFNNVGHVRIYRLLAGSWTQIGSDIDGESDGDRSGWSISLSADGATVAIGARNNDGNGTNSGHVRVYSYDGSSWTQVGSDLDGEATNDQSGYSVSLSDDGSTVAIGARFNDGNGTNAGQARVFSYDGSSWSQVGSDIDGEASGDNAGSSVSLSADGTALAIGAPYNDGNGSNSGHVRVYSYDGSSWTQVGSDINGEANADNSGWSVSLSADGTRLAIGARNNDGNGSNAGHVRLYQLIGSLWTQVGTDIDGEATEDLSGSAVSFSADGTTVAIGTPGNDAIATGYVQSYDVQVIFPIELTHFSAELNPDQQVSLNWITASEENNQGFEIERSADTRSWENIGFVAGAGTSNTLLRYTHLDIAPLSGRGYYRLKQIDMDGTSTYSHTVTLTYMQGADVLLVFPNPVQDVLTLEVAQASTPHFTLEIRNVQGQTVLRNTYSNANSIQVDVSALPSGVYSLQVNAGKTTIVERLVKQ